MSVRIFAGISAFQFNCWNQTQSKLSSAEDAPKADAHDADDAVQSWCQARKWEATDEGKKCPLACARSGAFGSRAFCAQLTAGLYGLASASRHKKATPCDPLLHVSSFEESDRCNCTSCSYPSQLSMVALTLVAAYEVPAVQPCKLQISSKNSGVH